MRRRLAAAVALLPTLAVTMGVASMQSPSWPQWRGPSRDGVASGFDAPAAWPASLTRAWVAVVGEGHASPVIAGSRVVVHAREGAQEAVSAFDLASGRRLWRQVYDAPYQMNPAARAHGPGPKSTPAVANGRVFTLGIGGILSAFDLATGRLLWRTPPPPTLPLYGTATSPIVDGDRVVAFMGGHDDGALTAFDAATGAVRWRWTGDGPGYASPVIAELGGTRHLITQSQRRLIGLAPADGTRRWDVPLRTSFDQNSVTPLVVDGLVVSSGLEQPTTAWRVTPTGTAWRVEEAWRNDRVSMYMSTPIASGGALFGLSHRNRGQFVALSLANGRALWTTRGREGDNASVVRAGPWLLLATTAGELIVARASTGRFEEVRRYVVADSAMWAHPALAGRAIVVKDVDRLIVWKVEG